MLCAEFGVLVREYFSTSQAPPSSMPAIVDCSAQEAFDSPFVMEKRRGGRVRTYSDVGRQAIVSSE